MLKRSLIAALIGFGLAAAPAVVSALALSLRIRFRFTTSPMTPPLCNRRGAGRFS